MEHFVDRVELNFERPESGLQVEPKIMLAEKAENFTQDKLGHIKEPDELRCTMHLKNNTDK